MSDNLGTNFNKEEKDNLLNFPSLNLDEITGGFSTSDYLPEGTFDFGNPLGVLDQFSFETNYFNTTEITKEIIEENKKKKEEGARTSITYKDPLKKIGGGRVLQYPIDLDTDIQDYFEIQVFKYRPAGSLPRIDSSNQGSNPAGAFQPSGSYFSGSNRRGNRQNFRLQDLQSTIQLPMPPSIKDNNSVDFAGGSMSGFAAQIFGPAVAKFLSGEAMPKTKDENLLQSIRSQATGILQGGVDLAKETLGAGFGALRNPEFRRVTQLNAIAQAVAALGVNIDVNQAITRTSGAVRNPNLELLFKGPALRNFSFTIRLTPRDPDEAKRIRKIIRVLKQHSAVKRNANIFGDAETSNFLLGTPDVFKSVSYTHLRAHET